MNLFITVVRTPEHIVSTDETAAVSAVLIFRSTIRIPHDVEFFLFSYKDYTHTHNGGVHVCIEKNKTSIETTLKRSQWLFADHSPGGN